MKFTTRVVSRSRFQELDNFIVGQWSDKLVVEYVRMNLLTAVLIQKL